MQVHIKKLPLTKKQDTWVGGGGDFLPHRGG